MEFCKMLNLLDMYSNIWRITVHATMPVSRGCFYFLHIYSGNICKTVQVILLNNREHEHDCRLLVKGNEPKMISFEYHTSQNISITKYGTKRQFEISAYSYFN